MSSCVQQPQTVWSELFLLLWLLGIPILISLVIHHSGNLKLRRIHHSHTRPSQEQALNSWVSRWSSVSRVMEEVIISPHHILVAIIISIRRTKFNSLSLLACLICIQWTQASTLSQASLAINQVVILPNRVGRVVNRCSHETTKQCHVNIFTGKYHNILVLKDAWRHKGALLFMMRSTQGSQRPPCWNQTEVW